MGGKEQSTHAIVKGTALPPIEDTMYRGARWEKGPNTGVTTSKTKITMATKFPKMIMGQRRPLMGPSEIQSARREYTTVKALPRVGYSFYNKRTFSQCDSYALSNIWETCNLGNAVDSWFVRFVMRFKPENERSGWLTSKGLHCFRG